MAVLYYIVTVYDSCTTKDDKIISSYPTYSERFYCLENAREYATDCLTDFEDTERGIRRYVEIAEVTNVKRYYNGSLNDEQIVKEK